MEEEFFGCMKRDTDVGREISIRTGKVFRFAATCNTSGGVSDENGALKIEVTRIMDVIIFEKFLPHSRSRFSIDIFGGRSIDAYRDVQLIEDC